MIPDCSSMQATPNICPKVASARLPSLPAPSACTKSPAIVDTFSDTEYLKVSSATTV